MRLPVGYFDKTQSGILISRVMTDAEGIRNLVGTGLVQLFGSVITAVLALGVLLYLNWRLTLITIVVLAAFGGIMGYAFKYLRPMFRERGKLQAEVTGRLSQSLGGIRVVKAYTAEKREEIVFAKGAHAMLRNVAKTMTGTSATFAGSTVIVGVIGVIMIIMGGQAIMSGQMTLGDLIMYLLFTGMLASPVIQIASIGTSITEAFAGLDRIAEIKQTATEDADDASRDSIDRVNGTVALRERVVRIHGEHAGAEGRVVRGAGGIDDRAGGLERFGQEHAGEPGDGVQPADVRRASASTAAISARCG